MVRVEFVALDHSGKETGTPPEGTIADDEGHFDLPGPDGTGLPPGKYRIGVRQWDPYPNLDQLKGRFDAKTSPIVRDVTGDEIIIDLAQPNG
jgi:hypothetical protein